MLFLWKPAPDIEKRAWEIDGLTATGTFDQLKLSSVAPFGQL